MSLDCVLNMLAENRPKEQTPAEWELAVKRRLKPPRITLGSYGGGGLDMVGQLSATLQSGPRSKTAVILVQKAAPEDLLLGTDLQPYLGFQRRVEGPAVELLPQPAKSVGAKWNSTKNPPSPVVRLLQAMRLPPCHSRVIYARVDTPTQGEVSMLTPICESWHEVGWVVEEGLVEVESDGTTTLVLRNPGDLALHLGEGDVLAKLQAVRELPNVGEGEQSLDPVVGMVSGLGSGRGRVEELLDQLEVKDTQLPETEATQLCQLCQVIDMPPPKYLRTRARVDAGR